MSKFLCGFFFWLFGVVTCLYYTAMTLNGCAQAPYLLALFSPLVIIPTSNALLLSVTRSGQIPPARTMYALGALNGMSVVVSSLLTLVLSPLCILAVIGFVVLSLASFFNLILRFIQPNHVNAFFDSLQMCAICAYYLSVATGPLVTSLAVRRRLKALLPSGRAPNWLPMNTCLAIILSCVLVAIFPVLLTHECESAISGGKMVPQGLLLLRALADDNALLQSCYGESSHVPAFFAVLGAFLDRGSSNIFQEKEAREIYYRVKGRPFNTLPRSQRFFLTSFEEPFFGTADMTWDDDYSYYLDYSDHDFAGETVGGIVRGLSLNKSKMTGWVDADDAVGHLQWDMNFDVRDGLNKEIRAQLLLPPHAVVTGCSLWLKGVRHDSVIATRNSTRHAYAQSAIAGEKPFLVSTAGAGRVLIQSPTGNWGTGAKLVVDITTPLAVVKPNEATLSLPVFTERNFAINAEHELAIRTSTANLNPPASKTSDALIKTNSTGDTVLGSITDSQLDQGKGTLVFRRDPAISDVVAPARGEFQTEVVQRIVPKMLSADSPALVVVDGSASMSNEMQGVCDVLESLALKHASIIWASDTPLLLVSDVSTTSPAWHQALDKLRDSSCLGGQNNAEALALAISSRGEKSDLNVVWLHAGQPAKFSGDALYNLLKNAHHAITLYEYQVAPGPNETIKDLDQTPNLVQIPRLGTVKEDLSALFDRLSGRTVSYEIERGPAISTGILPRLAKYPEEIDQLYVSDMVRLNAFSGDRKKFGSLAEALNLVTPLTNALVLEKESDYAKYNVKKHSDKNYSAAADSKVKTGLQDMFGGIPVKPEPPISLTLACAISGLGVYFWLTRRRRRAT